MGHKNYHNYSKPFNKENEQEPTMSTPAESIEPEVDSVEVQAEVVEPEAETVVEDTVEAAPELPTAVAGVVSGCKKLNVRNKPSTTAVIVTTINEGTEVVIAQPVIDGEFYKVTLANGMAGYCMKKFVTVK